MPQNLFIWHQIKVQGLLLRHQISNSIVLFIGCTVKFFKKKNENIFSSKGLRMGSF